jgi:hypothetical protein
MTTLVQFSLSSNEFDRTVSVLLGQGDGTFKSAGNLAVGPVLYLERRENASRS